MSGRTRRTRGVKPVVVHLPDLTAVRLLESSGSAAVRARCGPRSRPYSDRVNDQLVTILLPALVGRTAPPFNVFDVMHHGTHEKQLSNVFAWLLDREGTHGLGDHFQRAFIDAVNRGRPGTPMIPMGSFSVRQEVNIADPAEPMDSTLR